MSAQPIRLAGVATHHLVTIELQSDGGDGLFHHPNPTLTILIKKWQHAGLEFLIEIAGIRNLTRRGFVGTDRPPRHAFLPTLKPPPVQHTEVEDTVEGRLHATRTRGF